LVPKEQITILNNNIKFDFIDKLRTINKFPVKINKIDILQLNITKKCNLSCNHCHINAGPVRTELMSKKLLEKCLQIAWDDEISTIDITGGAPELHPDLEWFLKEISILKKRIIVRSNLVILKEAEYKKFIKFYTDNKIEIIASFPDLNEEKCNKQRGRNFFKTFIEIMKELNNRGYGQTNSSLIINLAHNPVGAYLPAAQSVLEKEYKKRLFNTYGIIFNSLFCITNMPLGKYLEFLIKTENLSDYMFDLCSSFNPSTINNMMCKNTLNVSWDGKLFNCDFNQILSLPIDKNETLNIMNFDKNILKEKEIVFNSHCFGCTAGSGSSCQGSIS
jgi:radical SAM/Cys-rich protein